MIHRDLGLAGGGKLSTRPALYHATLGAITAGRNTRGGIADYIGRKSPDIGHPLSVLEDAQLIAHEADPFRKAGPPTTSANH